MDLSSDSFCCVSFSSKSGSDGLLKLWTIKTNECVKTLDGHEDKIWGLHSNKQDDMVVTASSDSCIMLWKVTVRGLPVFPLWASNQNAVGELRIPVACSSLCQHDTCSPHFLHFEIGSVRHILGVGVFFGRTVFPRLML